MCGVGGGGDEKSLQFYDFQEHVRATFVVRCSLWYLKLPFVSWRIYYWKFASYSKFGVTRPNLVWLSVVCIYVTLYLDQYTMLFQMFLTFRHEILLFTIVGFRKPCLHAYGMVDSCGRILLYKDLLFIANQYWFSQAMVQRKWRMAVSIYWPLW